MSKVRTDKSGEDAAVNPSPLPITPALTRRGVLVGAAAALLIGCDDETSTSLPDSHMAPGDGQAPDAGVDLDTAAPGDVLVPDAAITGDTTRRPDFSVAPQPPPRPDGRIAPQPPPRRDGSP